MTSSPLPNLCQLNQESSGMIIKKNCEDFKDINEFTSCKTTVFRLFLYFITPTSNQFQDFFKPTSTLLKAISRPLEKYLKTTSSIMLNHFKDLLNSSTFFFFCFIPLKRKKLPPPGPNFLNH